MHVIENKTETNENDQKTAQMSDLKPNNMATMD